MEEPPVIAITHGSPTAEEVAALVGVLIGRAGPAPAPARANVTTWSRHSRPGAVAPSGLPARPGGTAWRESTLPR